jgi:hypothetical protein
MQSNQILIKNISDFPREFKDREVANNTLIKLQPGDTLAITRGAYLRTFKRFSSWMRKAEAVVPDTDEPVSTLEAVSEVVTEETQAEESVQESEVAKTATEEVQTESAPEETAEETEVIEAEISPAPSLDDMKLRDLKPIGEPLGIEWKPGMSTDAYREMVREKLNESEVKNETF